MKTKTPSGLTIVRENMKFTFGWKIADKDHDSRQEIRWRTSLSKSGKIKTGKWENLPLSEKATSKTVSLNANNYFPNGDRLVTVSFQIRGKRAPYQENNVTITPEFSDWAQRDYNILLPVKPNGSAELTDPIVTKFSWSTANSLKDNHIFHNHEWQTVLLKECNEKEETMIPFSPRKLGWATGTSTSSSGNRSITEDSVILRNNSYTRWFRVRAQGARGNSEWKYFHHVYAYPKKPTINDLKSSMSGGVTILNLTWEAPTDAAHPIDFTTVEYCVEVPETNMSCPGTATWNEARTQKDTGDLDGARVAVSAGPIVDQAMWVRLKCTHDYNDTYSNARFVRSGRLQNPDQITVSVDSSTHMATISAANNSTVPDSRLAVLFTTDKKNSQAPVIGIISSDATSVTVKCPEWDTGDHVAFGVYAFQGTETPSQKNGVTFYTINANMTSGIVWEGGDVPLAPGGLTAEISVTQGEVILDWSWTWTEANATELSWSQNPHAWESTDEPETYMITNLNEPHWRVSGLETGVRWYFRARFANVSGDDYNYGPYSETVEVDLTSAPVVPILALSRAIIAQGDTLTASWAYTTTDGTPQAFADICEASVLYETDDYGVDPATESITYGDVIAHETSAQHVDITPEWQTGSTHYLCVRVASASGHVSDWSKPVSVLVADPISCEITDSSIEPITITDLDGNQRTVDALTDMPLRVTVTGAGTTGLTTVIIERAAEYHMIRPDGGTADGYDGETIVITRQEGESQISISQEDLIGLFDDDAHYRLIATVEDSYGQTASDELEFEVHWAHQAEVPTAYDTITNGIAYIRADAPEPESYVQGDVIDIYRLSKDKPELIVQNGDYDTVYMDPYPTIGNYGHRVVARTVNGDYITEDDTPAWVDLPALYDEHSMIIDFDGGQLVLPFDITLQHKWTKDFKVTNYLGGSQQGDWNATISRTGTYTTNLVEGMDDELIEGIRTLARHSGICHVRTPEGSSYAADVQVSESQGFSTVGIVSFTMSVTRVDSETLDGIALED